MWFTFGIIIPPPSAFRSSVLIEYLESQLQAYKARTSLLQQEHLFVLDTLNEIIQRDKEELEQERNARVVALSRLRKVQDRLRGVEAERDDCQEAILQLIKKDPLLEEPFIVDDLRNDYGPQHSAYSNGLVHYLKCELYRERQAHALTRARVNILSAQVANRDAALEAWIQHADSTSAGGIHAHGNGKGKSKVQRDLDRSEILALYDQTAAKNKLLEQEAEETRQKATQLSRDPILSHPASPTSTVPEYPVPLSSAVNTALSDRPSYHPVQAVQPDRLRTTSPNSRCRSANHPSYVSPSPHRGRSLSTSRQPPGTSSKSRSRTRPQSHRHPSRPRSPSLIAFPPQDVIQDLGEQVRLLSIQIDGLRAERVALSRVIQSQREEMTVIPDTHHRDSSFDSFNTDGDQSFVAETNVEPGTRAVILEEHPDDDQLGHDISADAARNKGGDGDATEDGERSMEIATPLMSALVTFPSPSEGDKAARSVEPGGEPGAEENQGDGQIKMVRPRRGASVSPPMPP
ncbi:hypothetical protein C0995_011460 [Termitomyces sp. Mi166|nr:hypothetical protein C0995_011460 [Termitomyces sp. Mi166\